MKYRSKKKTGQKKNLIGGGRCGDKLEDCIGVFLRLLSSSSDNLFPTSSENIEDHISAKPLKQILSILEDNEGNIEKYKALKVPDVQAKIKSRLRRENSDKAINRLVDFQSRRGRNVNQLSYNEISPGVNNRYPRRTYSKSRDRNTHELSYNEIPSDVSNNRLQEVNTRPPPSNHASYYDEPSNHEEHLSQYRSEQINDYREEPYSRLPPPPVSAVPVHPPSPKKRKTPRVRYNKEPPARLPVVYSKNQENASKLWGKRNDTNRTPWQLPFKKISKQSILDPEGVAKIFQQALVKKNNNRRTKRKDSKTRVQAVAAHSGRIENYKVKSKSNRAEKFKKYRGNQWRSWRTKENNEANTKIKKENENKWLKFIKINWPEYIQWNYKNDPYKLKDLPLGMGRESDAYNEALDNIFKNTAAYSASQQPDGKIPDGGGLIWTPNKKMNYFDAIFNELKDRVSAASKDDKDSTNLKKRIIDLLYKYAYYTRGENIFGYASPNRVLHPDDYKLIHALDIRVVILAGDKYEGQISNDDAHWKVQFNQQQEEMKVRLVKYIEDWKKLLNHYLNKLLYIYNDDDAYNVVLYLINSIITKYNFTGGDSLARAPQSLISELAHAQPPGVKNDTMNVV